MFKNLKDQLNIRAHFISAFPRKIDLIALLFKVPKVMFLGFLETLPVEFRKPKHWLRVYC